MFWFKPKSKIEEAVKDILSAKLHHALKFYTKENERSHHPLQLSESQLLEIGGGMVLFFFGSYFPDTEKKNIEIMSRAYREAEKILPGMKIQPTRVYEWWKMFTDVLIFNQKEDRLKAATRLVWEKLITDMPYREASPLKTFGYYLQMEVDSHAKKNIG
jgi:hypothetical protein